MKRDKVFQDIRKRLSTIGLKEMQKRVGKKFYDMDEVVNVLYTAIISGKNAILYGPGGFGKTEVVKEFLIQAKETYYTIVGYEDMDVEGLLGLPNIDKMTKESVYEIAFDKTVFVKEGILVLEEFLDVNPKTAIALKDILTSGGYRQGDQFTESGISSVIICSNKSPYELSTDSSTAAFYRERFPIVYNVTWEGYSTYRYLEYIEKISDDFKKYKQKYEVLAELCYRTSRDGEIVSPRVVKDAIEVLRYNEFKLTALNYVDGLDTSILENVMLYCSMKDEESKINEVISGVNDYLMLVMDSDDSSSRYIIDTIAELNYIVERFKSLHVQSEVSLNLISNCRIKCRQVLDSMWNQIKIDSASGNKELIDKLFNV